MNNPFFHPDDARFSFAVNVKCYGDTRASSWSEHRTLTGAIRSARSIVFGRKHKVRTIETCRIWCKRSNALLTIERAEQMASEVTP